MSVKLSELLVEKNISILENVENWEVAVHLGARPLLENNVINNNYVDSMIEAVKQHGPYMVLTDHFALMHARPEDGANEVGMSMLIVRQPVDLIGNPIKMFIVLAAKDSDSHLEGLKEVAELIGDEEVFEVLLSSSKEEILKIIGEER